MLLHLDQVNVKAVVRDAVKVQGALLDSRVKIVDTVPDGLPLVEADRDRLLQILHNLIGNACKARRARTHAERKQKRSGARTCTVCCMMEIRRFSHYRPYCPDAPLTLTPSPFFAPPTHLFTPVHPPRGDHSRGASRRLGHGAHGIRHGDWHPRTISRSDLLRVRTGGRQPHAQVRRDGPWARARAQCAPCPSSSPIPARARFANGMEQELYE